MDIRATALPDVKLIAPRRFGDARGYFCETWSAPRLAEAGIGAGFVQDNESLSAQRGTLRGLHYQAPPFAQAKLVRVGRGAIRDVAVDARRGSPTYGRWVAEELSAENGLQLLVPRGFLHGFVTLTDDTLVLYKVDSVYDAASDGAVIWNDADLGIDWGLAEEEVVLSDKDRRAPAFRDWLSPFEYGVIHEASGDGRRGLHRLGGGAAGDRGRP
jgi:dTDP-4-dehydrorhamnose 3,5-epimerase